MNDDLGRRLDILERILRRTIGEREYTMLHLQATRQHDLDTIHPTKDGQQT